MVSFQVTLTLSDLQVPKSIPGICKFVDLFILGLGEAIDFKVEWPWMFIQLFNLFFGKFYTMWYWPEVRIYYQANGKLYVAYNFNYVTKLKNCSRS